MPWLGRLSAQISLTDISHHRQKPCSPEPCILHPKCTHSCSRIASPLRPLAWGFGCSVSCQIFISRVGNSARAGREVNIGTAAHQDTKVMGKASHGASEKIWALAPPLGHPPARNSLWEDVSGQLLAVLLSVPAFRLPFPEAGCPSSPAAVILLAFFTLLTTLLAFLMKRSSAQFITRGHLHQSTCL